MGLSVAFRTISSLCSTGTENGKIRTRRAYGLALEMRDIHGPLLAHYTLDLHGRFLITQVLLQTQPGDRALSLPTDTRILVDALKMSGAIMQLILNYRAKAFAGRYKGAVVGSVLVSLLEHAGNAPRIVGRSEVMGGASYADVVWDALLLLNCWQAWTYSSRIPAEEDEEDGK
ncbi:hypothetical protein C8R44DRAFT_741569 [Mycena epipterygia]|nr:hypothetical protein C8R44DRAFT_741569 [Mycena epipterygia]